MEVLRDTVDPVRRVKTHDIHQITTESRMCYGGNTLALITSSNDRFREQKMPVPCGTRTASHSRQVKNGVCENAQHTVINRRRRGRGQRSAPRLMDMVDQTVGGGQYCGGVMS